MVKKGWRARLLADEQKLTTSTLTLTEYLQFHHRVKETPSCSRNDQNVGHFPNLRNYIFKDYEFISPSENVEMMAEHCEKLLLDNDLWMETSRRLRHHSLQFNFTHIKEKLINIYKQYLNIKIL